jgi:predicted transcriptional regulator
MDTEQRKDIILKFISQNQCCTIEQVVKGVKRDISRVPVYDLLSELMEKGIVKDKKPNRRDHRLFVDTNNPIVEISREIEEFENAYISLLKKVREQINRRYHGVMDHDYSSLQHRSLNEASEFFYVTDLISRSLHVFSEVLRVYILRSTVLWPNIIRDKEFLNKLNSTVFAKFSDIRIRIHDIFGSIKIPKGRVSLDDLFHDPMLDTGTNLRDSFEKKFNDPNMKKESEKVLTFICKFIGDEMIRRAEYARTSKYMWDITQIDPEFIKKTIEGTYESHEDYENPFLKYKISL